MSLQPPSNSAARDPERERSGAGQDPELARRGAELEAAARRAVGWRTGLLWAAGLLWVGGLVALLWRGAAQYGGAPFGDVSEPNWLPAALAFGPLLAAPIAGWLAARRRRFARGEAEAWLDASAGGRGLLSAVADVGAGAWTPALREELRALPATAVARVSRQRVARALWLPLAFAALCVAAPMPRSRPDGLEPAAAMVAQRAEEIAERLEVLEEVVELDPEETQDFGERLEQLAAEAQQLDLEQAFEGLDRLEAELQRSAERSAEAAERALAQLAAGAESSLSMPEQAAAELSAALEELAQSGLGEQLPESALEQLEELRAELGAAAGNDSAAGGLEGLDPEQLAAMLEAFNALDAELREALAEALAKLGQAGLASDGLEALANLAPLDEALARALLEALEAAEHLDCEHAPGGM